MIKVRIVDNDKPLLKQQLRDFSLILLNLNDSPNLNGHFSCDYFADKNELHLHINNTNVCIDTIYVSLTKNVSFDQKKNDIISGLNGDRNILVVDYSLNGLDNVDDSFYLELKNHCDYELIYTGWSTYSRKNIETLKDAGCYFIERAVSDDKKTMLNWRIYTIAGYSPKYLAEMEQLADITLREICLSMAKSKCVNLRFLSTILLLIGRVM